MPKKSLKAPSFTWKLFSAQQLDVIASPGLIPARLNILDGAVRSGKTVASIIAWVNFVITYAPSGVPLLMVGRTERTLYRNVIEPMITMFGERYCRYRQAQGEFYFHGRLIYLVGASDERAEQKIRGLTVGGAYCDEITLLPESFFKMLLSRMSVAGARLYGTTNPDSPHHWFKRDYLDRSDELDLRRWVFRLEDNLSLPPAYVAALKKEYTGLFYKRFIDGLWCLAEGSIYEGIDPALHYVDRLPERIIDTYVSIDYGTTNPFVCLYLVIALHPDTSMPCLYVADELRYDSKKHGRQKTDSDYSMLLRTWLTSLPVQPTRLFVDPSAASFIVQAHKDGIPSLAPANNAVLDGIRETTTLIGQQRLLFVEPRVKEALGEMLSYVWDTKAQQSGSDAPLKKDDHAPDALRYGVRGTAHIWRRWVTARAHYYQTRQAQRSRHAGS